MMTHVAHRRRAAAVASVLILSACTGVTARQRAQLPTLQLAWGSIATEVVAGAEAKLDPPSVASVKAEVEAAMSALADGDYARIGQIRWLSLRQLAEAGIDVGVAAGRIGPGVKPSLVARLDAFGESLHSFLARS